MFFPIKKRSVWLFSVCLVFLFHSAVYSEEDWRPISPEELSMTKPRVEADADAEAIFWEVKVNDRSRVRLTLEHYVRVKIFTERGREKYSKFDIPYSKRMKIRDVAARVVKPDGSIVEIGNKDIFERDIIKISKVKVKAKSFAVPNIEPGVIVEYRYKEIIRNAGAVGMKLLFQRDIPIQKISYYYKPYRKKSEPEFQSYNFNDTKFVKVKKGFYLAERLDVPAFKGEPHMPPEDMVRPWMLLQAFDVSLTAVSRNSIGLVIKDPSNPLLFWSGFATEQQGLFNYAFKKDKTVKKVAEEIIASASTKEEKLKRLYEYCQTQIHNTTFDASLTDEEREKLPKIKSVKDVLKKKQASAGFIDLLFGALARSAGFDSRIVFSGDRSEMFFKQSMTNEDFVHRSAIAIKADGGWRFFNPGIKFCPYGMLAWHDENVWALLVGDKRYDWVKTPYSGINETRAVRNGKFKLLPDGTLEGEVKIELTGQLALDERLDGFNESDVKRKEDLTEELKSRLSTAEISEVTIENIENHLKPLVQRYKIRIPGYAQKTGKRLFFQPSVFEYGESAIFSSASRKYDVYFNYPWSEQDKIEIKLPDGFALDNAERPAPVADPSNIGKLDTSIGFDKANNKLIVNRKFHFANNGKMLFPVSVYPQLKNLFDAFHKGDGHTISLKKNAPLP